MTDRRVVEDYAEVVVTQASTPRLVEDYAEVPTQAGTPRLGEDYAEVVTVWQKMRLLTECYAEVVTTGSFAQPYAGWS